MSAEVLLLDARGLRCPLPVIHLARQAAACAPGTLVVVRWTDPAAAVDIPAWARMRGHTVALPGQDAYDDAVRTTYRGDVVQEPADDGPESGTTVVVLARTTTGRHPLGGAGPVAS